MKSASEHLFSNLNWQSLRKAPRLLKNLMFLVVAFAVIRLGAFLPVPGINNSAWTEFYRNSPFAQMGFPF